MPQRVMVTGGARGLGKEIARAFLKNGDSVCICSRNEAELRAAAGELQSEIRHDGQKILWQVADIGDTISVDRLFEYALEQLQGLEVLVNNAGIQGPIGRIEEQDWQELQRVIQVNLLGTVYCMRKAISCFRQQPAGKERSIISISGGGATGPRPFFLGYALAKTGIVRATETLARETKGFGIRLNSIAPGAMNTKMTEDILAAGERAGAE